MVLRGLDLTHELPVSHYSRIKSCWLKNPGLTTSDLSLSEMTLLSSQPASLEAATASTPNPEKRMLEKRAKVIEELLQTERDYIRDLEMCVQKVQMPLQEAQVSVACG